MKDVHFLDTLLSRCAEGEEEESGEDVLFPLSDSDRSILSYHN